MTNKKTIFILFGLISLILIINFSAAAVKTFKVKENDLVKFKAEAIDPDKDNIIYYYSPPLDDQGEWQTDFDDAGVYETEITASDGVNQVKQKVKIIVENKNQPPRLTDNQIIAKETQKIDLKKIVNDPDQDVLSYEFNPPFNKDGTWETTFSDAGLYTLEFTADDGEFKEKFRVGIEVLNTNQPPLIKQISPDEEIIQIEEDETLDFMAEAEDLDQDKLTYLWKLDGEIISKENSGEYIFDFESAGEHTLELTINDGTLQIEWIKTVQVENINRQPELNLLPLQVKEGGKVILDLPELDSDADILSYSFEFPLDEKGEWQTGYEDAGKYKLEITISDGEDTVKEKVEINIEDVDRAPILNLPKYLEAKEGELLTWNLDANDPDGDLIKVNFVGLPELFNYNEKNKTFTFTPSYDFIKRKGGFISNMLNRLRVERFFIENKVIPLEINACGKELCSQGKVSLVVHNTNRMPQFSKLGNITFTETDLVQFNAEASDPDGDIIHYYYGQPLKKNSGKWLTDYDDEGSYPIKITATDGQEGNTQTLNLMIKKKNRLPTLKVKKDQWIINEGEEISFSLSASDPDNDALTLRLDNHPSGASFKENTFTWKPEFNAVKTKTDTVWNNLISSSAYFNRKFNSERESYWLSFVAMDKEAEVIHPVEVIVKNINQAPQILDLIPEKEITAYAGETMVFKATVKDNDEDQLNYQWDLGLRQGSVQGTDTITRTFTSAGNKEVKVTVDDGRDSVEQIWKVQVYNPIAEEQEVLTPEPETEPFTIKIIVIEK
ncbi:MAG TPA: PKD domain-containing protein [Candidatus Nanoarchaeia archaeon]|nr:PKD domain-containing protein [Candidatus Nanoarchaeia archaeon]